MATQAKPVRRRPATGTNGRAAAGGARRATGRPGPKVPAGKSAGVELRGRLYDGSGKDRDVALTPGLVSDLGERQMLWLDLEGPGDEQISRIAELFQLEAETVASLGAASGPPHLRMFGEYLQLSVNAIDTGDDEERTTPLLLVAGRNFVISLRADPIEFLEAFKEQFRGDTRIGLIDGPAFLAAILDWHLTGYFQAVDRLERDADRLDQRALDPRSARDLLSDLVMLRRRISTVRRALVPHREVFAALTRPELGGLGDPDDTTIFRALADRLERAVDAAETARELVLGSFDVHMTRTAQRTNDVMKLLTLATVILLPGSVVAGIMGMNFRLGFFDEPLFFWVVLAVMGLIAAATLVVARRMRWI